MCALLQRTHGVGRRLRRLVAGFGAERPALAKRCGDGIHSGEGDLELSEPVEPTLHCEQTVPPPDHLRVKNDVAHAFAYFPPPVAALVAPTGGPTQGGTVIVVSGSDFAGSDQRQPANTNPGPNPNANAHANPNANSNPNRNPNPTLTLS